MIENIKNYNIVEDAVSKDMSNLTAGAGQVNIDVNEDLETRYLLNSEVTMTDVDGREHVGTVRSVSSSNGDSQITADDPIYKLNTDFELDAFPVLGREGVAIRRDVTIWEDNTPHPQPQYKAYGDGYLIRFYDGQVHRYDEYENYIDSIPISYRGIPQALKYVNGKFVWLFYWVNGGSSGPHEYVVYDTDFNVINSWEVSNTHYIGTFAIDPVTELIYSSRPNSATNITTYFAYGMDGNLDHTWTDPYEGRLPRAYAVHDGRLLVGYSNDDQIDVYHNGAWYGSITLPGTKRATGGLAVHEDVLYVVSANNTQTANAELDPRLEIWDLPNGETHFYRTLPPATSIATYGLIFTDIRAYLFTAQFISSRGEYPNQVRTSELSTLVYNLDSSSIVDLLSILCNTANVPFKIEYNTPERLEDEIRYYPGGKVNLWDELKEICSMRKIDISVEGNSLIFAHERTKEATLDYATSLDWSVDNMDAAKHVEVHYYPNPRWGTVEYPVNADIEFYPRDGNSDAQIIQVDANETVEVDLDLNAWVSEVNQPVYTEFVENRDYSFSHGVYSAVGNDNLPITASRWTDTGGDLRVEKTDDPSMVRVIVTGPSDESLAPYRIAMSSGNHYNSLHLTGKCYIWDRKTVRVATGADPMNTTQDVGAEVDSKHIQSMSDAYDVAYRVARTYAGPNLRMSGSAQELSDPSLSSTAAIIEAKDAHYRIVNVNTSPGSMEFAAAEDTTFEDFNNVWDGASFKDFNEQFPRSTFRDFALTPLERE